MVEGFPHHVKREGKCQGEITGEICRGRGMSGDHSVSAARNSSTQFSTGGGDERVAFKFGAGHAHWLTVTRHVTDLQLRERRPDRDRPIINTAGPRSAGRSTVRVSLERAPGLPPVCRQSTPSRERDRVTRNVTASILIS